MFLEHFTFACIKPRLRFGLVWTPTRSVSEVCKHAIVKCPSLACRYFQHVKNVLPHSDAACGLASEALRNREYHINVPGFQKSDAWSGVCGKIQLRHTLSLHVEDIRNSNNISTYRFAFGCPTPGDNPSIVCRKAPIVPRGHFWRHL